jgi:hypothetical protein
MPYNETHKIINEILYKLCSDCGKWLPLNEDYFYKNKTSLDGFNPYCKNDAKKRSAKWEKENPEQRKELKKKYDSKPERRLNRKEVSRIRRENGKLLEWQHNNPDKVKLYNELHRNHSITNNEWEACKSYFNFRCAYCELPLEEHFIKFKGKGIKDSSFKLRMTIFFKGCIILRALTREFFQFVSYSFKFLYFTSTNKVHFFIVNHCGYIEIFRHSFSCYFDWKKNIIFNRFII